MSDAEKLGNIVFHTDRQGHGSGYRRTVQFTCPWCGVLTTATPQAIATVKRDVWTEFLHAGCSNLACGRAVLLTLEHLTALQQGDGTTAMYPHGKSTYAPQGVDEARATFAKRGTATPQASTLVPRSRDAATCKLPRVRS